MKLLAIAVILAACGPSRTPQESPAVQVVQCGAAEPEALLVDAARVWSPFGFKVSGARSSEAECPRSWYEIPGPADCQITIDVCTVPGPIGSGPDVAGLADRDSRSIELEARHTSEDLARLAVMAHEAGHILLDAGHLPEGQHGVMQASVMSWDLTSSDYEHACASIGVCLDFPAAE